MSSDGSLRDLLARIRAGDSDAATALVRQYEPELRRYIRYRLSDLRLRRFVDSLDVAQSVFARFFVSLAEGRIDLVHPQQLFKLLFTIATNRLRDQFRWMRRGKRAHALAEGPPEETLDAVADQEPDPSQQVAEDELVQLFQQRLSDTERTLLAGRMAGRSWQELAAESPHSPASNVAPRSPEALRKQLARAIDRVAHELGLGTE
jgi:RNA polymerase sigma factor (sigma-70 family)